MLEMSDDNFDELIDRIKLPKSNFELLEQRYLSVGKYIDGYDKVGYFKEVNVYPQGSVKQGTLIKHQDNNSFDVDIVVEFTVNLTKYSQKEIREEFKKLLDSYVKENGMKNNIEENKRSYTMKYSDEQFNFHIDFTPVIKFNNNYYLTNNTTLEYSKISLNLERTNPQAFSEWFDDKNRELYSNYYQKELQQLDRGKITKLQKCIMLTKYSKDIELNVNLKSIVITVIMAETFNYILTFEENFRLFKKRLLLEYSKDNVNICNPTEPSENFVEKFNRLSNVVKNDFIDALKDWEFIGTEFIEEGDYSHALNIDGKYDSNVEIIAKYKTSGFRDIPFQNGEKIPKRKKNNVTFEVKYDKIGVYNIEWQVTNERKSAMKNAASGRGTIEDKNKGKKIIEEPISFTGQHWVRCCLIHKITGEKLISNKFKVNII